MSEKPVARCGLTSKSKSESNSIPNQIRGWLLAPILKSEKERPLIRAAW
jgi:hypothetical protein